MAFLSRLQNCLSGKSVTATAISIGINIYSRGKPKSYLLLLFSLSFSFFFNRKHWKKVLTKFLWKHFRVRHKSKCKKLSKVTIKISFIVILKKIVTNNLCYCFSSKIWVCGWRKKLWIKAKAFKIMYLWKILFGVCFLNQSHLHLLKQSPLRPAFPLGLEGWGQRFAD